MTDPDWRKLPRKWTPDRQRELSLMIDNGLAWDSIAAHFGCSPDAVKLTCKRYGIPTIKRRRNLHSARSVARMLGIEGNEKTVTAWLRKGWLKGVQRIPRGPHLGWVVQHDDLLAFLEDPRYWHLWDAERIPAESGFRWWALELRREHYLTVGQVAWRLCVTNNAVGQWIRRGLLPAVRRGNWLIPASALADFTPPGQCSRKGQRHQAWRWTAEEDASLLKLRAQGWTFARISEELGRSVGAVSNRLYRLEERLEVAS